ncbi:ATP-grasp domain-containing protein [Actinokineospora enzanensis]|uniref:ATP-grasp domain-containing protein n=1 Tax=Actinokineospora enzanensis TaxID=155975 RepID=UPI0012EC4BD6|nr:ATP-grasp domain-containing protein [Actinokineospora enzanensis]
MPDGPMHLLVLGDEREIIEFARTLRTELRTSVLCLPADARKHPKTEEHRRVFVLPEGTPLAEWVAVGRFIHEREPVDGIVCFNETGQEAAAAIAAALGLPWHPPDTVRAVDDKRLMRERLAEHGVDRTGYLDSPTPEQIVAFAERVGYPLICKPVDGVGSHGVVRLDRAEDIAACLDRARSGAVELGGSKVMVEKFHVGEEFSVESFSEDGEHLPLCITKKYLLPGTFVELGHVLPAPVSEQRAERIGAAVVAALTALGIRHGVTHTEVIATEDGVHIVETHLRQGGDRIPYLLAGAREVDIVPALARQSLGLPALEDLRGQVDKAATGRYAAIWYATPDTTGKITEVCGEQEARDRPGVREVTVRKSAGDFLSGITSSSARPAWVWAVGDTAEEALATAQQAVRAVRFVVGESDAD